MADDNGASERVTVKSFVQAFYEGGVSIKARSTMTHEEVHRVMRESKQLGSDAKITDLLANGDINNLYLTRNKLLFYSVMPPQATPIVQPVSTSKIELPR
jgi:hypothetical protein